MQFSLSFLVYLQSADASDFNTFKDLPDEIALPIVIGTTVTGKDSPYLIFRSVQSIVDLTSCLILI